MTRKSSIIRPRMHAPWRQWPSPSVYLLAIAAWFFTSLFGRVRPALADDSWLLTTAEFRSQPITLQGIDSQGLLVRAAGGDSKQVPLDRLLLLDRTEKPAPSATNRFVVILSGNDRAAGAAEAINGENLIWNSPVLGRLTLPMRSVVAIVRAGQPLPAPRDPATTQQTEDIVSLLNGDSVHGIITGLAAAAVSVQQPGGDTTDVPLETVARVTFASTGAAPAGLAGGYRVSLDDGSAITASRIGLGADQVFHFLPADGLDRSVPLTSVVSIEQIDGPVVWLSSLRPIESVQTPFLDLSWPARMDQAVDGESIRFGQRSYARGIGVHSYSRLAYAIDPSWKAFRTQYAMAGEWPYADVTVRIKLDGKVVHEQADLRSGVLAPPVVIDLDGNQKQLTLEVDYGQNYDVQDRFNWIEPAFLRFKPQPQQLPATTRSAQ